MNQSLNMAEGGGLASRMRGLHDYFDQQPQESNMTKTDVGILEVIKRVTALRDAWSEMLRKGAASGSADNQSQSEVLSGEMRKP